MYVARPSFHGVGVLGFTVKIVGCVSPCVVDGVGARRPFGRSDELKDPEEKTGVHVSSKDTPSGYRLSNTRLLG